MVGISEHVGHTITYKLLTTDTFKFIYRSEIRSAEDPTAKNVHADILNYEPPTKYLKDNTDSHPQTVIDEDGEKKEETKQRGMTTFDPTDLVGRTFLMEQKDGQHLQTCIVKAIEDYDANLEQNPTRIKFICDVGDGQFEEIMSYNEILNYIQDGEGDSTVWKFHRIIGHQGPLTCTHPDYKGSTYNVQIEWENNEITFEPLGIIGKDDPVTCALYAKDMGVLKHQGGSNSSR